MGDVEVDPSMVGAAILAIFIVVLVGPTLARAKRDAALPLLASCPTIIVEWIRGGNLPADHVILCGAGGIVFLAIPGMIGLWLLVFRNVQ